MTSFSPTTLPAVATRKSTKRVLDLGGEAAVLRLALLGDVHVAQHLEDVDTASPICRLNGSRGLRMPSMRKRTCISSRVEYNFYAHRLTRATRSKWDAPAPVHRLRLRAVEGLPPRKASALTRAPTSSSARSASSGRIPVAEKANVGWRCIQMIRRCRSAAAPSSSWPASSSGRPI